MKNTSLARNHKNHSINECPAVNKENHQIGTIGNNVFNQCCAQDVSRFVFFRFQQKKKQSDVELVVVPDVETATSLAAETTASPANYRSPIRHGPGQPYITTGAMLMGFGFATFLLALAYFACYALWGWGATLPDWSRLFGNLALLGIAGGAVCVPLGMFYQVIGIIFSRHEPRPGNVVSYVTAGIPWVLFLVVTTFTPGFITPFLHVAYPLVIFTYILNILGLYRMLHSKNLGIWCMQYLLTWPSLLVLLLGPAALTIWQALGPVFK